MLASPLTPFSAEIEAAVPAGRRRVARVPVSLDAKIGRGGLDRALCRVCDLSVHGARLQTFSALRPGTSLFLTMPGAEPREARVVWADDFTAGCEFRHPLPAELFHSLAGG